MVKFKAWNASNSRAIAKFHNAEIGHFGHNMFIHELIRGSLVDLLFVRITQLIKTLHIRQTGAQRARGDKNLCQKTGESCA